jgi:MFS family permease
MDAAVALPALTALLAAGFSLALVDQWRHRRQAYQAIWAVGMACYAVAAAAEGALALEPTETAYRVWYLVGGIWTVGWLGLGSAYLLSRTRFGYAFAFSLFLAGLFTFLTPRRDPEAFAFVGLMPMVYFILAGVLALAVAVETYFQNWRWPWMALLAVGGATVVSGLLALTMQLPPPGYAIDAATGIPVATIIPGELRLLSPFTNVTGGLVLILGALFSVYVFMPKRRLLAYSLDPSQSGDQFLFNLLIAPVAISVNFLASLPGAVRALARGELNSRVPATLLIALGALIPSIADTLARMGTPDLHQVGVLLGVVFLFAGFLVSKETFAEIRVPFTSLVLRGPRTEPSEATRR